MTIPFPKKVKHKRIKPTAKTMNRMRGAERRSERAERRSGLRTSVVDRSEGVCEWSGCGGEGVHMAHIEGIGRGGDPTGVRDKPENVAMLCVFHHDMLDGRAPLRLWQIERLLAEVIKLRSER